MNIIMGASGQVGSAILEKLSAKKCSRHIGDQKSRKR